MVKRAGFGLRLAAYFLDIFIISSICIIIQILHQAGILDFNPFQGESKKLVLAGISFKTFGVSGVLIFLVYWFIEGLTGASPGKYMMRLRIRAQLGNAAGRMMLLKRFSIKNLAYIFAFLGAISNDSALFSLISVLLATVFVIGCFMSLHSSSLSLHDIVVGSAVFRTKDLAESI